MHYIDRVIKKKQRNNQFIHSWAPLLLYKITKTTPTTQPARKNKKAEKLSICNEIVYETVGSFDQTPYTFASSF